MKFDELNLSPEVMSGLNDVNYEEPTSLQETVIPAILEGKDALINPREDKGKIASFVIPALEQIVRAEEPDKGTRILILTPHPEDAKTIDELVWAMGYHAQIDCAPVDLDGDWDEQEKAINDGADVIVGNPGRLIDILSKNHFILRDVFLLVIDKADEMLKLNLRNRIKDIEKRVISDHQTLIYSSKFSGEVKDFANQMLKEPNYLGFRIPGSDGQAQEPPPEIPQRLKQGYINVPSRMKITTLMAHIESTPSDRCVIFTASKRGTDRLYRVFRKRNLKATSLHGKLSDEKKAQRFSNFISGDVDYLLVADLSAADLDIDGVQQVINYDVPGDPNEYRYRAGLVGSGKAGRIVSLVSKQDRSDINKLENELGQSPEELPLPKEVQQKLKERKEKKKKPKKGKKDKKKKQGKKLELPRPSYDKLSGGREGKKEKDETGAIIGLIKKIFTS